MAVQVKKCQLFNETAAEHGLQAGTPLFKSFADFVKTKITNPIAPYGASDKSNPTGTPMAIEVPKIRHAHLTQDISIFYTVGGKDPTELKLYAMLSHAQAGTGQPLNPKKQKGVARQMRNQDFS